MKHVMKGSISRRALLLVAPAIVGALVWGGVASGTPPAGVSTKTTLADVTVIDTVKADVPPLIKFRTTDQVEVAQFSNTAQPADPTIGQAAFSSGWHMHTGPIIIAVAADPDRLESGRGSSTPRELVAMSGTDPLSLTRGAARACLTHGAPSPVGAMGGGKSPRCSFAPVGFDDLRRGPARKHR